MWNRQAPSPPSFAGSSVLDSLNHAEKAVETAVQSLFGRVTRWTHAHPRRLAAGTATVLAVIAGTAFGLAPMAPDASALPKRLGIADVQLNAFLQADAISRKLWQGRAGKLVSATTDDDGKLTELV